MQLDALPSGPLPPTGDEGRVGLRDVAGLGQQESHGVLGGREDVRLGCVDHHHPSSGGRGHVDVVETDPGPADDHEVGTGFDQVTGHLGRRPDDERGRAGNGGE